MIRNIYVSTMSHITFLSLLCLYDTACCVKYIRQQKIRNTWKSLQNNIDACWCIVFFEFHICLFNNMCVYPIENISISLLSEMWNFIRVHRMPLPHSRCGHGPFWIWKSEFYRDLPQNSRNSHDDVAENAACYGNNSEYRSYQMKSNRLMAVEQVF